MSNLARDLSRDDATQLVAIVAYDDDQLIVKTSEDRYAARRAVSCLVEPEAGDEVLCSVLADGRVFILAVLTRDCRDVTLASDGNLEVRPAGRFSVATGAGVDLVSSGEVNVTSDALNVNSRSGSVMVAELRYLGRFLQSEVQTVKTIAQTLDQVLERVSQRVKRSYRTVEETDQLRAERIDHVADKTMSLRGKNTVVTAQDLVKVDGSQIHLG